MAAFPAHLSHGLFQPNLSARRLSMDRFPKMGSAKSNPPHIGPLLEKGPVAGGAVSCLELIPEPPGVVVDNDLKRAVRLEMLEQLSDNCVTMLGVNVRYIDHALLPVPILGHDS
jgi:hypothetical protein